MKWLVFVFLFCLPMMVHAQNKVNAKAIGAALPPFTIVKTNGTAITNPLLKKGKPVMVIIFSPECDHCERVLDSLKTMAGNFKNTQLLLVTEARHKGLLSKFLKKINLDNMPAFNNTGWDGGNLIYDIYTYQHLPQVNIYSERYKLVHTLAGSFPLDSLRYFIK